MTQNAAPRRSARKAVLACALMALPLIAMPLVAAPAAPPPPATSSLAMPCLAAQQDFLKLPPGRLLGDVSAVTLGPKGHVWVLHRPGTLAPEQRAKALPPVAEFTAAGAFIGGFGGPHEGYEWPQVEHSLAVSPTGHVWISGNYRTEAARADDMVLEFAPGGRFVRQIGRRGGSTGNADTGNVHAPGDLTLDWPRRELYVADGYGNRRVAVIDVDNGRFRRIWGAWGKTPTLDPAPNPRPAGKPFVPETGDGPADFNGVHGVAIARDGKVYVSDRNNQRIQVFTRQGRYLAQVFVDRNLPSPMTASGIAFSDDAAQRFLYVADFGNAALVVIDRQRLAVVGRVGTGTGTAPMFTTPHLLASDGKGHLFVSEVTARRVTRLTITPRCKPGA